MARDIRDSMRQSVRDRLRLRWREVRVLDDPAIESLWRTFVDRFVLDVRLFSKMYEECVFLPHAFDAVEVRPHTIWLADCMSAVPEYHLNLLQGCEKAATGWAFAGSNNQVCHAMPMHPSMPLIVTCDEAPSVALFAAHDMAHEVCVVRRPRGRKLAT